MAYLAILAAKLLDPVLAILVLIIVLFSKNKIIILVAAAISTIIAEQVLIAISPTYLGNKWFITLTAALIWSSLWYFIRSKLKKNNKVQINS